MLVPDRRWLVVAPKDQGPVFWVASGASCSAAANIPLRSPRYRQDGKFKTVSALREREPQALQRSITWTALATNTDQTGTRQCPGWIIALTIAVQSMDHAGAISGPRRWFLIPFSDRAYLRDCVFASFTRSWPQRRSDLENDTVGVRARVVGDQRQCPLRACRCTSGL